MSGKVPSLPTVLCEACVGSEYKSRWRSLGCFTIYTGSELSLMLSGEVAVYYTHSVTKLDDDSWGRQRGRHHERRGVCLGFSRNSLCLLLVAVGAV